MNTFHLANQHLYTFVTIIIIIGKTNYFFGYFN